MELINILVCAIFIALVGLIDHDHSEQGIGSFRIEVNRQYYPLDLQYVITEDSISVLIIPSNAFPGRENMRWVYHYFDKKEQIEVLRTINDVDFSKIYGSHITECVTGGLVLDIHIKIPNQEVRHVHLANYYDEESAKITEIIDTYLPEGPPPISYEEKKPYLLRLMAKCPY